MHVLFVLKLQIINSSPNPVYLVKMLLVRKVGWTKKASREPSSRSWMKIPELEDLKEYM